MRRDTNCEGQKFLLHFKLIHLTNRKTSAESSARPARVVQLYVKSLYVTDAEKTSGFIFASLLMAPLAGPPPTPRDAFKEV